MRILIFYPHYLPGYRAGGPITSLSNLVDRLGDEIEFFVVTLNHDFNDTKRFADISQGWNRVGKAQVRYLAGEEANSDTISSIIREIHPEKLYLNSFFDQVFTKKIIFGWRGKLPIILAPRGEFSMGALAQKALKKRIYLAAWKLLGLSKGVVWQASTALEATDIKREIGAVPIRIASDIGTAGAAVDWSPRGQGEPLRICFLSRVSPMKNLKGALGALSKVQAPIIFDIFGPKEDIEYWRSCQDEIASMPRHITVTYRGAVAPIDVVQTIGRYDLFFLPTLGENYGHVIIEALGAGVPALISDKTPWRDLEDHLVGWTPADATRYPSLIEGVASWTPEKQKDVRKRCVEYATERTASTEILAANRDMFLKN